MRMVVIDAVRDLVAVGQGAIGLDSVDLDTIAVINMRRAVRRCILYSRNGKADSIVISSQPAVLEIVVRVVQNDVSIGTPETERIN